MDASKLLAKTQLKEQHIFFWNLKMLCSLFSSDQVRLPVITVSALKSSICLSKRIVILLSQWVQSDAHKSFGSLQMSYGFSCHCYVTDFLNQVLK